jgi:hypothetical protein
MNSQLWCGGVCTWWCVHVVVCARGGVCTWWCVHVVGAVLMQKPPYSTHSTDSHTLQHTQPHPATHYPTGSSTHAAPPSGAHAAPPSGKQANLEESVAWLGDA